MCIFLKMEWEVSKLVQFLFRHNMTLVLNLKNHGIKKSRSQTDSCVYHCVYQPYLIPSDIF